MSAGPSDYLAAERTFLAWIRTGLALMGFGFVVARFGLFLRAMQAGQPNLPDQTFGLSFWFGTALIVVGVVVNLWSAWHHVQLVGELNRGASGFARPSTMAIVVAVILAVIGLGMAVYLISMSQPSAAMHSGGEKRIMATNLDSGIVTIASAGTVDQTIAKLQAILQAKGVKLFALVDHSGEAERAGLTMRPTKLLIFGNPKAGTPLMVAASNTAIDLPLKILVAEDDAGKVWISYNSPTFLQTRHRFPQDLLPNIAVVEALAAAAAK